MFHGNYNQFARPATSILVLIYDIILNSSSRLLPAQVFLRFFMSGLGPALAQLADLCRTSLAHAARAFRDGTRQQQQKNNNKNVCLSTCTGVRTNDLQSTYSSIIVVPSILLYYDTFIIIFFFFFFSVLIIQPCYCVERWCHQLHHPGSRGVQNIILVR